MMETMKTFVCFAIGLFFIVGFDLMLGGKLTHKVGKVMNKKINIDHYAIQFLAGLRSNSEKEIANVDQTLLQSKMRSFVGLILIIAAVFMFYSMYLSKSTM